MNRPHLVFRLGEREVALPTSRVARVAEVTRVVHLPSDLDSNLGLVVEAGVVAALVDLAARLDGSPPRRTVETPCSCVFARFRRGVVGFPVDAVLGVRRLAVPATDEAILRLDLDRLEGGWT
ncbi:MAG: chemotaxis protein CheW [Acidobacteriota bacterium]